MAALIERCADADDQRVSRVYLTDGARALWPQVADVWNTIDAQMFGGLTVEERVLLRRLLIQVQASLLEAG